MRIQTVVKVKPNAHGETGVSVYNRNLKVDTSQAFQVDILVHSTYCPNSLISQQTSPVVEYSVLLNADLLQHVLTVEPFSLDCGFPILVL